MKIKNIFRKKTNYRNSETNKNHLLFVNTDYDFVHFKSSNQEDLDKLVDFYKGAKEACNPEFRDKFFDKVCESCFTITDVVPGEIDNSDGKEASEVDYGSQEVYFSKDVIEGKKYSTFYHEFGHIIDYKADRFKKSFDKLNEVFKDFAPSFYDKNEFSKLLFGCFLLFQVEYNEFREKLNEKMDSDSITDMIIDRTENEYKRIYDTEDFDDKLFNELAYESYYYYRDSFYRESGLNSVSDIFDALTIGRLSSTDIPIGNSEKKTKETGGPFINSIYYGHSSEYFKDIDARSKEIIADVSALCSAGKKDLLYKYFPDEIAKGMIDAYEITLNHDHKVDYSNAFGEDVEVYDNDSIKKRGKM